MEDISDFWVYVRGEKLEIRVDLLVVVRFVCLYNYAPQP